MFDLNDGINQWRRALAESGVLRRDDLDELENHLRDEVQSLVESGQAIECAFRMAAERLGDVRDLTDEFLKVCDDEPGVFMGMDGEVLVMDAERASRSDYFATFLLFVGFSGIAAWGATMLIGLPWAFSACFLLFAVLALPGGFRIFRRSQRKIRLLVQSLIPALVLSPLYGVIAIGAFLMLPFLYAATTGSNIVQSVLSPDGNFEAYVEEAPSIDPPNQTLFIQRSDGLRFVQIAKLIEDVDSIKEIQWSPSSDLVVFRTGFNLFAVHVPGYETLRIPLGGEFRRTKPSKLSTFAGGGPLRHVTAIEFPEPGAFSYRLEGSGESHLVPMDSF